jgi:hypothetical protein
MVNNKTNIFSIFLSVYLILSYITKVFSTFIHLSMFVSFVSNRVKFPKLKNKFKYNYRPFQIPT